jgi:hypothetical protein
MEFAPCERFFGKTLNAAAGVSNRRYEPDQVKCGIPRQYVLPDILDLWNQTEARISGSSFCSNNVHCTLSRRPMASKVILISQNYGN